MLALPVRLELLFFPGCPHVPAARAQLRRACEALGLPPAWEELDTTQADTPAHARGFGSPSILVDGHDVLGAAPGDGSSCRLYVGTDTPGAPPLEALVAALRAASAR